jgi:hypothetical protein
MLFTVVLCAALLPYTAVPSRAAADSPGHHDKAFWKSIIHNDFKVPAGDSPSELAAELSRNLASPDPELRDEIAYDILSTWIYKTHQLDGAPLRSLSAEWLNNLAAVEDPAPNSVLRRSFSALLLSVVVARDNADPILDKPEFLKIWDGALAYLIAEKDLRGFDDEIGWIHSAAHTADLLKFLARSRFIGKEEQPVLLNAIGRKLTTSTVAFIYGEDERYARAVLSIIARKDFDADAFAKWAKDIRPVFPKNGRPNEQMLHGIQNVKNCLAKLDFLLSLQPDQTPGLKSAEESVRASIKGSF